MPTNFFAYGQDFDKDGKIDLWHNLPDIFSSIANYLKKNRWRYKKPIGHHIKLPPRFNKRVINKNYFTNNIWNKKKILDIFDKKLPLNTPKSKIVSLTMLNTNYLLVYYNFRVILRWNRSHLFGYKTILLAQNLK